METELDKDTKEILDEMKDEGVAPEAEESQDEKEEEEKEEESSEEKSSEDDEEEGDSEDEPSEDDESETSEEDEEEQDASPYKQQKMTVAKHQKKKKNWEKKLLEKEEKIKELETKLSSTSTQELDSKISKLAEEYGFDKKFIEGVADAVKSTIPNVSEDLKVFKEQQREQIQNSLYLKDFEENISPLIQSEYPDIKQSQVNKIQAELKKLKFTKELSAVPLDYIFTKHRSKFDSIISPKIKKTAESSRSGSGSRDKIVDYSSITPDDIKNMSDKEFDKYSEAMAKGKSTLVVGSK